VAEQGLLILLMGLIVALLTLLLAEGLRWLAGRNGRQRDTLIKRIRQMEKDLKAEDAQLQRYAPRSSPRYRALYDQTQKRLDEAAAIRRALMSNGRLQFPRIPATGLALSHFARRPADGWRIMQTAWQLHRHQAQLTQSETALTAAAAGLEHLHNLAHQLQSDCAQVQQQLAVLDAAIQVEQDAGIHLPTNLLAQVTQARQETGHLAHRLRTPERVSADDAETLDKQLTAVETAVKQLTEQIASLHRARQQVEQLAAQTAVAVAKIATPPPAVAATPGWRTLYRTLTTMQTEATQLARLTHYGEAEALLRNMEPISQYAQNLVNTQTLVFDLWQWRDDMLDAQPLTRVANQLAEASATTEALLGVFAGRRANMPFDTAVMQQLTSLNTQIRQLFSQAQIIQKNHHADAQQLQREANQAGSALTKAWDTLQRTVPLADRDPLVQAYNAVQQQRQSTQGSPAKLAAYIARTHTLTEDFRQSQSYLQERLQVTRPFTEAMPRLVSEVEGQAGMWLCLRPLLTQFKENAAAMQQIWSQVLRGAQLTAVHRQLDELKLLNLQQKNIAQTVEIQSTQLNRLLNQIQEMLDNLEEARQDKGFELAQMRHNWALQEPEFAKAIAALEDAKLIVRRLEI
jgi:hypothetical protein